MTQRTIPIFKGRQCGECHRCCEGWSEAEVFGVQHYPGKPCFYLGHDCTIYEDRDDVCREFFCEWVSSYAFPEWMKPTLSNLIIIRRIKDGVIYFQVKETGVTMKAKYLNWLLLWALRENKNLLYELEGAWNRFGSQEFLTLRIE